MKKLKVKDPFNGQVLKEYLVEDFKQIQQKVNKAHEAQKLWSRVPVEQRVVLVGRALEYFEVNKSQVAEDISRQMGRPLAQAYGEIKGLFERAQYMCRIAQASLSDDVIEDTRDFYRAIQHTPLGVVFTISAWNYPLLVTVNSVVPALLSGNTVVLKHSSLTPEMGIHFERALGNMDGIEGLVQNLVIDHETTGRVIEELDVNHVVFTGSVSGGRQILQHTSKRFFCPHLELGGKDGAYVMSDGDLDLAAETLVDGAMFNSGQSCCGIERVYVDEDVHDQFVEKCKLLIDKYKLGDPKNESTDLGPQANPSSIDLMLSQVNQAKKLGARVLAGGEDKLIGEARFMEPTLLVDVNHSMDVVKEENFGPIMPIVKVGNATEAIKLINDSSYGLTSSIFSSNSEKAMLIASELNTGTVFLNRCDYLDPALPWTGVKDSGFGSGLSKYGFYGVTRRKAIHFKK